jgi:hypothetical protein
MQRQLCSRWNKQKLCAMIGRGCQLSCLRQYYNEEIIFPNFVVRNNSEKRSERKAPSISMMKRHEWKEAEGKLLILFSVRRSWISRASSCFFFFLLFIDRWCYIARKRKRCGLLRHWIFSTEFWWDMSASIFLANISVGISTEVDFQRWFWIVARRTHNIIMFKIDNSEIICLWWLASVPSYCPYDEAYEPPTIDILHPYARNPLAEWETTTSASIHHIQLGGRCEDNASILQDENE